jgi:hypothetical protein
LPTVVSPLHASEQHDPTAVSERDFDVQQIYNSADPDTALLGDSQIARTGPRPPR